MSTIESILKINLLIVGVLVGVLFWKPMSGSLKKWIVIGSVMILMTTSIWGYKLAIPISTVTNTLEPSPTPKSNSPLIAANGTLASGEVDDYFFKISDQRIVTIVVQPVEYFPFTLQILYSNGVKITEVSNDQYKPNQKLFFAPESQVEYIFRILTRGYGGSYVITATAQPENGRGSK